MDLKNFVSDASAAGIDGLILPDLPQYEFETEYGAIIKKYGLDFIFPCYTGNIRRKNKKTG
jgi:tryptophan synthase alpha chain